MKLPVSEQQLATWLEAGLAFSAEYEDGLSNHLPMNLIALTRIGADADECQRFIASYTPRLEPVYAVKSGASGDAPIADWTASLGAHTRNAAYRAFFDAEIARHGRAHVLRAYLSKLAPGVSGGAFHPLIRLSFALEADSDLEVAESLASWCMAYQELAPLVTSGTDSPQALLQRIRDTPPGPTPIAGNNLYDRLKSAAALPEFAAYNGVIAATSTTLAALAETALAIYASSNNGFLALHLVTCVHAARRCLPFVEDQSAFIAALAQSLTAAYLVLGRPSIRPSAPALTPSWDAILATAARSQNDHDAKFCYALKDEQSVYGDDGYRREAARRLKLI